MVISVGGSKRGVGICFKKCPYRWFRLLLDNLVYSDRVFILNRPPLGPHPLVCPATSYGSGSAVSFLSVGCNSICTVYSVLSTKTAN